MDILYNTYFAEESRSHPATKLYLVFILFMSYECMYLCIGIHQSLILIGF